MQRQLRLSWHDVDPSEAITELVREEAAHLERYSDRIVGCAVTLEAPSQHHRQGGSRFRVRIELDVPGAKLVVGRNPPLTQLHADLYAAVKAAFREAQRRLEDHVRRRHAQVKAHAEPARGKVARLLPDDGYGFLLTPDGREVYFHSHSVLRGGFRRLRVGSEVRFVEEAGDEGPQASTVALLRPRRTTTAGREPAARQVR